MIFHSLARNCVAQAQIVGAHTKFNFTHKWSWQKITTTKPWNYSRYCPLCSANEILQKTLWKRRTWWLTPEIHFAQGSVCTQRSTEWQADLPVPGWAKSDAQHYPLAVCPSQAVPFPLSLVPLSCPWLTTRSDKKSRTVKSEPDCTCPQHSQSRTEIKHLWNCREPNLQNTKFPQLSALTGQAVEWRAGQKGPGSYF